MHFTSSWLLTLLGSSQLATATPIRNAAGLAERFPRRQGYPTTPSLHDSSLRAEVHGPEWPEWGNSTSRWSTFSQPTFEAVFIPETEQDLSEGIKLLTGNNIPLFAQGGGHGYSTTLGSIQNAVLINLENFNEVTIEEDGTAKVGGAARFSDIYPAAYAKGRELTLGSCPCVGATGATLGGGHGRLQGKHGLSADALQKVRLVLWNGDVVEASATENADLFWGLRGAGQNFGVVVESTFQTYPQENDGQHYNADMVFTDDSLEGVLAAINELIPDQDPGLAMDLIFFADPSSLTSIIFLNLIYAGPEEQGDKYADYFSTTTGQNTTSNSTTGGITRLSNNATMIPWDRIPFESAGGAIAAACAKGLRQNTYSTNLRQFDVNQTSSLYADFRDFVQTNPLASGSIILYEIFSQAGVLTAADTASANRQYGNILALVEMAYQDDTVAETADSWAKGWRDAMVQPEISGYDRAYVYQNYAHGDEPIGAYYGYEPERLERLSKLKTQYDPHGVFNGYHAIPTQ